MVSSTLNATLARAMRAERTRVDLTQREFAVEMGWSEKTVMRIEAGDRPLYAHELVEVCRFFGIGFRALLVTATASDLEALDL